MFKKIVTNPFFIFPLLTCIVFWPISLQLFTLKNDALTYYYPIRTLISDALNNQELPLWTPYINMGYPLHADMQSGAWNPVIWLFSFLANYNLVAFHYELLFYICFGGIGFFYLCRKYGWSKSTAFTIGIAYQFCGFIVDSVQFFVCISAACYLPYIFLFIKRLFTTYKLNDSLAAAFFLYLFFTGSYPSLFIILCYFLFAYALFIFLKTTGKIIYLRKNFFPLGMLIIIFIILSLPAIISFVQHLHYIDRGKSQTLDFVLENSMPPFSMLSLISPFSTTANMDWLQTDRLMRNSFIGIIPLLFLLYGISKKELRKNKEVKFFFITGLILFGLAWGSYFFLRQLAYYLLPLMDSFRHPAVFRLFGIFCFLLVAGFSIHSFQNNGPGKENLRLAKITTGLFTAVLLAGIFMVLADNGNLFTQYGWDFSIQNLKNVITQLTFSERFLFQAPVVLIVLFIFYLILRKKRSFQLIVLLSAVDLFIATQYNMPVTVIGAKRFTEVEKLINRNPQRFPLPGNNSIEENSLNSTDTFLTGSKLPFTKKIGRNEYYITPGNLSLQQKFYESPVREKVFKRPVIYFGNSTGKESFINITHFSANEIKCDVYNTSLSSVVYLQNYYPGWKAFIDGKRVPVNRVNITFMEVAMPSGRHTLSFYYDPALIKYSWYVSICTLLILVTFQLVVYFRKRSFFGRVKI